VSAPVFEGSIGDSLQSVLEEAAEADRRALWERELQLLLSRLGDRRESVRATLSDLAVMSVPPADRVVSNVMARRAGTPVVEVVHLSHGGSVRVTFDRTGRASRPGRDEVRTEVLYSVLNSTNVFNMGHLARYKTGDSMAFGPAAALLEEIFAPEIDRTVTRVRERILHAVDKLSEAAAASIRRVLMTALRKEVTTLLERGLDSADAHMVIDEYVVKSVMDS
jgi:hypothetical protein